MTKPGLLPVMILMLGFVDGGPNLQNNVSLLYENTIQKKFVIPAKAGIQKTSVIRTITAIVAGFLSIAMG